MDTIINHPKLYDLLLQIKETIDCRVYFHKAAYEYLYLKQIKTSLRSVSKAIELFEDPKIEVTVDVKNLSTEILTILSDIESKASPNYLIQMYKLAAEIYAELNDYDNSLKMYEKFYYLINDVPLPKEIINKTEIVVYSFRNYNAYSLEDLINDEITCVQPVKMNDPFDSLASYLSDSKFLEKLCSKKKHIKPQSDCFKHFTIRSFVANRKTYADDDRLLFNKLMWSHYADSHKGFCVKYRIKNKACKQFDSENEVFTRLIPVEYTKKKTSIFQKLDTDNSFAMKNSAWKKESEVRFVHFSRDCDADHTSIKLNDDIVIDEVILGLNCTEDAKKTIANIVDGKCQLSEIYNDNEKDIYTLKKRLLTPN